MKRVHGNIKRVVSETFPSMHVIERRGMYEWNDLTWRCSDEDEIFTCIVKSPFERGFGCSYDCSGSTLLD